MVSHKVAEGLYLTSVEVPPDPRTTILPPSVHRIFVVDASGSMYNDMPAVRQHIKNKLATTMRDTDTITIIWFSGRGEFGVVVEAVKVRDAAEKAMLDRAVDKFLRPMGLTGFKEPLDEVARVVARLRAQDPDAAFSMVFMSDGHDNQWKREDILASARRVAEDMSAVTVVEYGWYANRPMLVALAEEMGGEYEFSEDFSRFAPALDAGMTRRVAGTSKRLLTLPAMPIHGVAFTPRDGALSTFGVTVDAQGGFELRIPTDLQRFAFLSETPVGLDMGPLPADPRQGIPSEVMDGLYAAMAFLSQRMASGDVLRILAALGDLEFVARFSSCFGKQQYSAFRELAVAAASNPELRYQAGFKVGAVPAEDAYTVLDLIAELSGDDANQLMVDDPSFNYQSIGRKMVSANERLSDADKAVLEGMAVGARSLADLEAIKTQLEQMTAGRVKELKFEADKSADGVSFEGVVLNETRPNVSIRTMRTGTVAVGEDAPESLPVKVRTHIWRNYTIVRDGILNLKALPMRLGQATHAKLLAEGRVSGAWRPETVFQVSLDGLPVVNRKMVKTVSAEECFKLAYDLQKAKAAQKVFNWYQEQVAPKDSAAGLKAVYGEEAAAWLAERGVTDGGFNPRKVQGEASDVYIGRELTISLKGLKSLPTVKDVEARLATNKAPTPVQNLMVPAIREWQGFSAQNQNAEAQAVWLKAKAAGTVAETRRLMRRISEIKFAIVMGQVWFPEFSSLDEGTLLVTADDGTEFTGTAELKEVEFEI